MSDRSVMDIAQEALDNFEKMSWRMSSIANGNDQHFSPYWPDEDNIFPPLVEFINKQKQLKKELEGMINV